jgi:hypothetical protein
MLSKKGREKKVNKKNSIKNKKINKIFILKISKYFYKNSFN